MCSWVEMRRGGGKVAGGLGNGIFLLVGGEPEDEEGGNARWATSKGYIFQIKLSD